MNQVRIKRAVERVPGGMTVVPLLGAATLVTLFPDIPNFFGSFTGALKVGIGILLGGAFGTAWTARRVGARGT